jgi:hypothetical protein
MRIETSRGTPRRRTGEEGSAYIAVLMVLVVLTIFGLALSMITQTEMQVGGNERTVNRVFYAADSGVKTAIAELLANNEFPGRTFLYTDSGLQLAPSEDGTPVLAARVDVLPVLLIQQGPCNLCEINQAGGYGGRDYYKTTNVINATATRFSTMDGGDERVPIAQKTISAMVEIQPHDPSTELMNASSDPEVIAKYKF